MELNKTDRELLARAFLEAAEDEFSYVPAEEDIDLEFSPEFERKMEKLIRARKRPYYKYINTVGKRVAAIIIAVVIFFSTAMTVEAIRVPVINCLVKVYDTFNKYVFGIDATGSNALDCLEKTYYLKEVPEGFQLMQEMVSEEQNLHVWANEEGNILQFRQQTLVNSIVIDNENVTRKTITIRGQEAFLTTKNDGLWKGIVWATPDYNFALICNKADAFTNEELITMAENLVVKEARQQE